MTTTLDPQTITASVQGASATSQPTRLTQRTKPAPSQANIDRAEQLDQRRGEILGRVKQLDTDGVESEFFRTMSARHRRALELTVSPNANLNWIRDVFGMIEQQLACYADPEGFVARRNGNRRPAAKRTGDAVSLEDYAPGSDALKAETIRRQILQIGGAITALNRLEEKRAKMVSQRPEDADRQQVLRDVKSIRRPVPPKATEEQLMRLTRVLEMLSKEISSYRREGQPSVVRGERRPRRGQNGWGKPRTEMTAEEAAQAAAQSTEALARQANLRVGPANAQPAGPSVHGKVIAKKKKPGKK